MQDEIKRGRFFILQFLKSLFFREPDEEILELWKKVLSELREVAADYRTSLQIDKVYNLLQKTPLPDISKEYYSLFVDPFSDNSVELNASWYKDGRNFGPTLVEVRSLMQQVGVVKEDDVGLPEDNLIVLLDLLVTLEESGEYDAEREVIDRFLIPLLQALSVKLKEKESVFYTEFAQLIKTQIEAERERLN